MPSYFANSFPIKLLHNIEQSSLCYSVGPCWLSILNKAVCTCQHQFLEDFTNLLSQVYRSLRSSLSFKRCPGKLLSCFLHFIPFCLKFIMSVLRISLRNRSSLMWLLFSILFPLPDVGPGT